MNRMKGGLIVNCNEIRDLMSLYIDSELDTTERIQFEEHVASCEACSYELEMLKEIVGTLNETEIVPLPDNFHKDLMKTIHEIEQEKHEENNKFILFLSQLFTKKFMVPAVSLACIMLVLVVARNPLIMNDGLMVEKTEKSANKMAAYDTAANEEVAKEAQVEAKSETSNTELMRDEAKEESKTESDLESIEEFEVAGELELALTYGEAVASPEFIQMDDAVYEIIDVFKSFEDIFIQVVNDLNGVEPITIQLTPLGEISFEFDEDALIESLKKKFEHINFYSSAELPKGDYYMIVIVQEETTDKNTAILQVFSQDSNLYKEYHVEIQERGMVLRQNIEY